MAVSLLTNNAVSPTINVNAQSASYTAVLGDGSNTLVTINNASANTFTIPPNSSVAFPVGTILNIAQTGAGQTTITQGSGVTIVSTCLLYTSPSPRDRTRSRMPSSA